MAGKVVWTDAGAKELARRWKRGERASVIATAMGFSRCAVVGKLDRLGLLGLTKKERARRLKQARTPEWRTKIIATCTEPGWRKAQSRRMTLFYAQKKSSLAVGEGTRSGPNTQNQQSTPGIIASGGGEPR